MSSAEALASSSMKIAFRAAASRLVMVVSAPAIRGGHHRAEIGRCVEGRRDGGLAGHRAPGAGGGP